MQHGDDNLVNNLVKMLKARGFFIKEEELQLLLLDGEVTLSNDEDTIIVNLFTAPPFLLGAKPHLFDDRKAYENAIKVVVSRRPPKVAMIIIVPSGIDYKDLSDSEHITLFHEAELAFDPTDHVLVPTHIRISSSPFPREDLPLMPLRDPISKWYGYKRGDVIKITRDYSDEVYYRRVI